jgi:peptidoglycan/xylan/chitin deacetylase (PgdA/CDA1 family)
MSSPIPPLPSRSEHRWLRPAGGPGRTQVGLAAEVLEARECPAANLIPNASVESPDATLKAPLYWHASSSGQKPATFTYVTPGLDGQRAVRVDARDGGNAAWSFDNIPVAAGQTYTFKDLYKSNVETTVTVRLVMKDGTARTLGGFNVPKSTVTKTFTVDFTAPADAVSATVYHTIARKGYLITDGFSLVAVTPPDTTAPAVAVTRPPLILSGSVSLVAQASDDVGVAGVRFLIGNTLVGSEVTAPPYVYLLDTTTLPNGQHTVAAVARDAAGNSTTSAAATFTVDNPVPPPTPTPANIIPNPSVETLDPAGNPVGWSQGGWGANTSAYSVVAGVDAARAVRVDTTAYSNGDAKWFFTSVPVTGGNTYTFSDQYRSNRASELTARYTLADGTNSYVWMASLGASSAWTTATATLTAPANAVAMTMFHLIAGTGWLETDKYSLTPQTTTPHPAAGTGMITLAFDDGWTSQLQNAVPVLQQANLPASFYVITRANQGGQAWEEVQNPSLETAAGDSPAGWNKVQTGANAAAFNYANTGSDGARSARIDVTSYTSGLAGWAFQEVQVTPGSRYSLSHQYNSDVPTTVIVRFTRHDGSTVDQTFALAATNGQWSTQALTVTAPANADAMTVLHSISRVGSLSVDNYSVKPIDPYSNPSYLTPAQIQSLYAAGYEVGDHTMTHADLATLSAAGARAEVDGARSDLIALGITPKTFVYPYGSYTALVQQIVQQEEFIGARTVVEGLNATGADPYALRHHEVDVGTTVAQVQAWIAEAQQTKTWLILTFHEVDTGGREYSTTPDTFRQIVNLVSSSGLTPVTMADGLARL